MPIYEYRCADCERSFEAFVRPGRDDAECRSCHGSKLVRELSVFAACGGSNGDASAAAAIASNGRPSGGGCCGGACGCH